MLRAYAYQYNYHVIGNVAYNIMQFGHEDMMSAQGLPSWMQFMLTKCLLIVAGDAGSEAKGL
jgi:hypothetical protein